MIDALVELDSVRAHLVATAGQQRALLPDEVRMLIVAAAEAEDLIRENWPYRTGTSRDGWRVFVEDLGLRFLNTVEYAQWVHFSGELQTAWADAFALVDQFIIDPLIEALKAAITANQQPQTTGFAQANQSLARLGVIRLVPAGGRS